MYQSDQLRILPARIKDARRAIVQDMVAGRTPSEATWREASALPTKACENIDCHMEHISEDCPFELWCSGCLASTHVYSDCQEECTRCGRTGHDHTRCVATTYKNKQLLFPARPPSRIQRRVWVRRLLPGLRERLRREAEEEKDFDHLHREAEAVAEAVRILVGYVFVA